MLLLILFLTILCFMGLAAQITLFIQGSVVPVWLTVTTSIVAILNIIVSINILTK